MSTSPALWWIRRDLRLADNPALNAAAATGEVVPLFILDDTLWAPSGDARRAWLLGALGALDGAIGGHLVIREGDPVDQVVTVAREVGALSVFAAADFGPYGRRRDDAAAAALADRGVEVEWTGSPYAVEPGSVVKDDGTPFKVFTPFSRAWVAHGWSEPLAVPARIAWAHDVPGVELPSVPVVSARLPTAGEEAAERCWERFRKEELDDYAAKRNEPAGDHTSRLSVYLRWGCIHPRTLLTGLDVSRRSHSVFRSELAWREFYADVLWHHPDSARASLQPAMATMRADRGRKADDRFDAWASGRTGFPIVDAGMRQLLGEGWMHNRLRMITASFLVKDLHIAWTRGARHFMRYLVDGDLASNNHGWQWVAGTGTDAAPYFRIFNPVLQSKKFDPEGAYIRRWVPELRSVPAQDIHDPWAAGGLPLDASAYPEPIVDHHVEREEALARYQATRG
ncbi:MAG: DNA photolyase family protein [Actinomycetota bacterium]|nr:DNA photolyase family protein [Actinomycetota bacterium]